MRSRRTWPNSSAQLQMPDDSRGGRSERFWLGFLRVVTLGVIVFGLALVVAPALAREGFSLLVYGSAGRIDDFGSEAADYIGLAHAVMGSVMVGWGTALLLVLRGEPTGRLREKLLIFVISLAAWFIPDTAFSLISGFWQNAVLNTVFALLFAIPLTSLLSMRDETRARGD